MENPTFRLEGVVKIKDEMEDFEGPLTLILQLLSKNKIEIRDIQIALLLEQYLAYLDEVKSMDLEIASEFVAMASHLVYIKTRTILYADEENTELEELMSSLEKLRSRDVYVQIKGVTEQFSEMYKRGSGTFTKPMEPLPEEKQYNYQHDKADLLEAIRRVLAKDNGEASIRPPRPFVMPKPLIYSVTDKANEILKKLSSGHVMRLTAFFESVQSRTELVATFLAVLELCKAGRLFLSGVEDDLRISSAGGNMEEIDLEAGEGENGDT